MKNYYVEYQHSKSVEKRSPHWASDRRNHLIKEGECQWCGSKKDLEVHHIKPFCDNPELERDPKNLITLCQGVGRQCHLKFGHLGNFKFSHLTIREDCDEHRRDKDYKPKP